MIRAVRERVTIQPGGRIELENLDFPPGAEAEVIVMVEKPMDPSPVSPADTDQKLINAEEPPDYRAFLQVPNADEADQWSWDWAGPDQDLQPRILPRETGSA